MVAAMILAAGESSRMGRPKAFLRQELTGTTFLAHLVAQARAAGLAPILIVGRAGDTGLEAAAEGEGARFVPNPRAAEGQLSSLLAGLDALESYGGGAVSGVVVTPVDVPLVTAGVIEALLRAAEIPGVLIARAAHLGRHGHPVFFSREVFEELRRADPNAGARAVVRADPARVRDVEVGEPGVTLDIDTPDDYQRAFGRKL
jgi:molybdenum cofactor cytidylyltransferase